MKNTSTQTSLNINKQELLKHFKDSVKNDHEVTGLRSLHEAGVYFDAAINTIKHFLSAGHKVTVSQFGIFESKLRGARTGHNPQTGAPIKIKQYYQPSFKASSGLKTLLNPGRNDVAPSTTKKTK